MKIIKYFYLVTIFFALVNCKTNEHEFPLAKRYWDITDYKDVIYELRYRYNDDEKLPTFNNSEDRLVVEKLTDKSNYIVVLEDKELGINYKNEVATSFFNHWKDMNKIYSLTDRKDKYIYEKEFLAVYHFGLGVQLKYFRLGNELIKENADDPTSLSIENILNSNISTLINNYLFYLNEINKENTFTESGKEKLAEGINIHFIELFNTYPNADYKLMQNKAELMLKKSENEIIKSSLINLIKVLSTKND